MLSTERKVLFTRATEAAGGLLMSRVLGGRERKLLVAVQTRRLMTLRQGAQEGRERS